METQNILFFLPTTILAIVSIVFWFLWRSNLSSSWQWAAGFAQTTAGFALSSFPIEPTFDQFTSGFLYIGAAYCYGSAILIHFKRPIFRKTRLGMVLGFTVTHLLFILWMPSLRWDLFLIEAVFSALFGFAVWNGQNAVKAKVDNAFIVSSWLVVADCMVRGAIFTFVYETSHDMGDFVHSGYNIAVHVSTITVCLFFPFTAIAAMTSAAISQHRTASEKDPMTGLLNRRGFDEAVARTGPGNSSSGSVIVCDIDHFKQINDNFGHAAGDLVIKEVAKGLSRGVGRNAHVARFGGEEFVIHLPNSNEADAVKIANVLREGLEGRAWFDFGIDRKVTASFGVAEQAIHEDMVSTIARADKSLYFAKVSGRNRVCPASHVDQNLFGRAEVEAFGIQPLRTQQVEASYSQTEKFYVQSI